MAVVFDGEVADRLVRAVGRLATEVDAVASWWMLLEGPARVDFSGAYAERFANACEAEQDDRRILLNSLRSLGEQIASVAAQAAREKQRQRDLQAWEEREAERVRKRESGDFLEEASGFLEGVVDWRPSDEPIRPEQIHAVFRTREWQMGVGGRGRGRSSADAGQLRAYAGRVRTGIAELEAHVGELDRAWRLFAEECSWAEVDSVSCVFGSMEYLGALRDSADAVDQVASAFERAGGGSLSNLLVASWSSAAIPPGLAAVWSPSLSRVDVEEAFAALGLSAADIAALPLATQYQIANLDGIPAAARDIASRAVLAAAQERPAEVQQLMGVQMDPTEFVGHVSALQAALEEADRIASGNLSVAGGVAQLVGFGVDDGVLTAAISIGDLDAASNVEVNVPGANSSLRETSGTMVRAAETALRVAQKCDSGGNYASVSWMGYGAPHASAVGSADWAEDAAPRFVGFLDGMVEARGGELPKITSVAAHSAGSSMAAEALKLTRFPVTAFTSYGSIGFARGTKVSELRASRVYAIRGAADGVAGVGEGVSLGGRTDPRNFSGVTELSAEAGPGTTAVTGHDMAPDPRVDPEGIGYRSAGSTSVTSMGKILATGMP